VAVAIVPLLCATAARPPSGYRATGTIAVSPWPYFPGSTLAVRVDGFSPPYHVALLGAGSFHSDGTYEVSGTAAPAETLLVAGNRGGLAARIVRIAAPPPPSEPLLAVASYDDGVVFHDARRFSVLGILATGGAPSDDAIDASGRVASTDTQGTAVTVASLSPWRVSHISNVPFGDEIATDDALNALFVTNRDVGGNGALTRVASDGSVAMVVTGRTAEGLAIDQRRQLVYVANVNDDTVAVVNARSMHVVRRFPAVPRVFSLALSPDGLRLYAVSNQSAASPFAAPGAVVAIDLRGPRPRVVARSGDLDFPIGEALDARSGTLFVTDEELDVVDVLDARTLAAKRAPLATCRTPWKPTIDPAGRLFVPCARADRIDAFDTRTLHRLPHAPFATGGYPLAVAVWPGSRASNASRRR
jgi:hypothetical protein